MLSSKSLKGLDSPTTRFRDPDDVDVDVRKQFDAQVVDLARRLKLDGWNIDVAWDQLPGEDALAENDLAWASRNCRLRLSDRLLDLPERTRTHVLLHELVHCHLAGLRQLPGELVDGQLGARAEHVFDRAVLYEVERATDGLADALFGLMVDDGPPYGE